MKFCLLVFCFFIVFFGNSQKVVERVVQGIDYSEFFTVLKKKKKIMHGLYSKKSNDGTLLTEGYYTQGQRSGIWTYYDEEGRIQSKGKRNGYEKDSIWEYYGSTGLVEKRIDHSNTNEIVYYDPKADTTKHLVLIDGVEKNVRLDWPSYYKGNESDYLKTISENFSYPQEAMEKGESGTVYITFIIGVDGIAKEHKVVKSASPSIDAEALRVIKLIPNKWVAPIYNGQPVESYFSMPISARLG